MAITGHYVWCMDEMDDGHYGSKLENGHKLKMAIIEHKWTQFANGHN